MLFVTSALFILLVHGRDQIFQRIGVVQLGDPHLPPLVLSFQRSVGIFLFQCIRRTIRQPFQLIHVAAFKRIPDLVCSGVLNHFFQRVVSKSITRILLCLVNRFHGLAFCFQIGQLHGLRSFHVEGVVRTSV